MKKPETLHLLPVRAESAAPALLRGKKLDQRAVFQLVRKVDWKKAGLIAGGTAAVCAAAGTVSRYKFYQGIVARELKKQLAPLNDKLDALQDENRMLRAELEKKQRDRTGARVLIACFQPLVALGIGFVPARIGVGAVRRHREVDPLIRLCGQRKFVGNIAIARLGKGGNITTDVLLKIYETLNCHMEDILEIIDEYGEIKCLMKKES